MRAGSVDQTGVWNGVQTETDMILIAETRGEIKEETREGIHPTTAEGATRSEIVENEVRT